MDEATCIIEGCEKPRRERSRTGWCRMHQARYERHGDPLAVRPNRTKVSVHSSGYLMIHDSDHPLARRRIVYAHRQVLYDSIGPGSHACHWCGRQVAWFPGVDDEQLTVDHVDANRQNNDLANLVPACGACNSSRGSVTASERRTHCRNGHEYTPDNQVSVGGKHCRICYETRVGGRKPT
jgi:hypothetical protein